jgi:hypothetical protein
MEPESSLPESQVPATCLYPEPTPSSPHNSPTFRKSILILSSNLRLGLPNGLFPSGFPTNTLCTPLYSSIRATCPAQSFFSILPPAQYWVRNTDHSAPHHVTIHFYPKSTQFLFTISTFPFTSCVNLGNILSKSISAFSRVLSLFEVNIQACVPYEMTSILFY